MKSSPYKKDQVIDRIRGSFNDPGKSLVIIAGIKNKAAKATNIKTGKKSLVARPEPHSFNTFIVK